VVALFMQAGRGLAAAHREGLVHRDFKPDNVLVDRDEGRVLVTDFGLVSIRPEARTRNETSQVARLLPPGRSLSSSDASTLTETGAVMGTPAYMAPEQHLGHATDARSDQFSFCAALWEGLYGLRPFEGETIDELAVNVLGGKLVKPPGAAVPSWLREIVARGLSIDPARRFESMDALLDEIAHHTRRSSARRGGVLAAAAAAVFVAAGLGLLQLGGTDATEIAQRQIARLEAALEHSEAELARAVAQLEIERARSQKVREERARELETERLQLVEARRAREQELLSLHEQITVLAAGGREQRAPRVVVEARKGELESRDRDGSAEKTALPVSRPDSPAQLADPLLPVRPGQSSILAAIAEVRGEVIRCGKLRDFSSKRSYAKWESAGLSHFSGEVSVRIVIRSDGTVERATARGAPDAIARCIEKRVNEAAFSRSIAGRVYTHVFTFPERN
jgi:hypothetical protein